jgi:heme-degrading monooxygenase HmoA
MPELPWRSFGRAQSEKEYVVLLTFLPLQHGWKLPWFLLYTARVMKQLRTAKGLIGYSMLAKPLRKRFWTLSAWEDDASLNRFVHARPHKDIMTLMSPHMGKTEFVRWSVKAVEIPPSWNDALRRAGMAS